MKQHEAKIQATKVQNEHYRSPWWDAKGSAAMAIHAWPYLKTAEVSVTGCRTKSAATGAVRSALRGILGCGIVVLLCAGCPLPDTCVPNTTRCTDVNTVELCDPDGAWRTALDCADLGTPGWSCCDSAEGHTCLPAEECAP